LNGQVSENPVEIKVRGGFVSDRRLPFALKPDYQFTIFAGKTL